ncbi:hypothetical protein ACFQ3Z_01070 [Streptomyces nogalater]
MGQAATGRGEILEEGGRPMVRVDASMTGRRAADGDPVAGVPPTVSR